ASYESIRNVLWDTNSPYAHRSFSVFLQGSYNNDTNVYGDSDVDIVICTNAVYYSDTSNLSEDDNQNFNAGFTRSVYELSDVKTHVVSWLNRKYPGSVTIGNKAVYIKENSGRRAADVVIAAEFRRYYSFPSGGQPGFHTGICFFTSGGTRIDNFPK